MKVLLTGGSGMVGQNILEHVARKKHVVLSPSSGEFNLLSWTSTAQYINKEQPDIIVHAAGKVGGIQANMIDPVGFLVDNLDMGRNLVMAARQARVPKVLNLGSSCMYPRDVQNPLSEELVLAGTLEPTNEGYALAKCMTARLCDYTTSMDGTLAYKTLVPCNIYGLHDKFDPAVSHLLPAIIRKIHNAVQTGAKSVEIWGDGTARREFMFASDLADAIWACINNFDQVPQAMNVGLGTDFSINEYYQAAAKVLGFGGEFTHDLSRPVGMKQKLLDVSKQTKFGWSPRVSLQEGVAQTYEFFVKNNRS